MWNLLSMMKPILNRLVRSLSVLLIGITFIFIIVRLTGDPAQVLLPDNGTMEEYRMLQRELGLDKPVYTQYGIFVRDLAKGNFGISARSRVPVKILLSQRLSNSMRLAAVSMLILILIGFPLGIMAATNRGKPLDWVSIMIAAIGQSFPSFYLALLSIQLFAIKLRVLPIAGMYSLSSYILPASTLAFVLMPGIIRLLRSSMIEVLGSEYIRLARIKGVSEKVVIWKHALRNALIPVVNYSGIVFSLMIMTAVVIETIFCWPGIGSLLWEAVLSRDFSVVQTIVFVFILLVVIVNLIMDIMCFYIDPRIRHRD